MALIQAACWCTRYRTKKKKGHDFGFVSFMTRRHCAHRASGTAKAPNQSSGILRHDVTVSIDSIRALSTSINTSVRVSVWMCVPLFLSVCSSISQSRVPHRLGKKRSFVQRHLSLQIEKETQRGTTTNETATAKILETFQAEFLQSVILEEASENSGCLPNLSGQLLRL